ncbi:MAG: sulfatase-like hydrolase/transferase [Verrucomicrobiota bacterium]
MQKFVLHSARPLARILLTIALLSPLLLHTPVDAADKKPNIVLVMADDQGWGEMGYIGHPKLKTPNFDSMAKDGLRFDRFYAAAPVCSPTRGSVLTGRHPNRFGCFKWGNTLRPQEVTIAEALKTAGYTTGHFGKWHLGSVINGSPVTPGASGFDEWVSAPNFFDNNPILSDQGKAVAFKGESSEVTVDAALKFISKNAKKEKPFFAVVWFGSPHSPHIAAKEDFKLYKDAPKKLQNLYGEITGMDRAFGKLRSSLNDLGVKDNTVLWYCSDNGAIQKIGDTGGFRGWKGMIYEGGLLVPAIMEWPAKISKARISMSRCNTVDIYPTLLEIAGIKVSHSHPLDGISLLPLIEGAESQRSKAMGFWDTNTKGVGTPSKGWMTDLLAKQKAGQQEEDPLRLRMDAGEIKKQYNIDELGGHAAWIDGDWKLHRIINKKSKKLSYELYNLDKDKFEEHDMIAEENERAEKMKAALSTWQNSVIDSLNGKDYSNE